MRQATAGQPSALPVFSKRLDELLAAMVKGEAPNVGRFCGYCYTPLGKKAEVCPHCRHTFAEYEPVAKLPPDFIALYRRMRKRESLLVNAFAFAGIFLAVMLFVGLVAVAVYRYNAAYWALGIATLVLFVTARVFAGLLGGWIGDGIAYDFAQKRLAVEWEAYETARADQQGRTPRVFLPAAAMTAASASAPGHR